MSALRPCILFDFGGVIGHPQREATYSDLAGVLGSTDPDALREAYRHFRADYDRGVLDGPAYWRLVLDRAGLAPRSTPVEDLIRLDTESWTVINRDMLDLMRRLKGRGAVLGLLSNMPPEAARTIRGGYPWVSELFENVTFSCELGVIKPEPGIYAAAARGLGVPPSGCLFVDDTPANVAGARACGFGAVLFQSAEGLAAELAGAGWT